ncbi:hypothetical protein [Cryobacterium aureum]|uniref:hypothetical protein n=1 Tax=Cryobacterium aureum TaxID=995037 RepID=UPI000CF55335|nr:hypothetical protein [Cryobacterium aureum]
MTNASKSIIVDGLGAYAVTFFEMGDSREVARGKLLAEWQRFGEPVGVFHMAAKAIGEFPQPVLESVAASERKGLIREMLGAQSPEQQLVATLRAREVLEKLGNEFG